MGRDRQKAQGLIEYMLILAVVALAIIGFAVAYKPLGEDAKNTMEDSIQTSVNAVQN